MSDLEPGRFFLPGPTEVCAEVLEAQVRPLMGHRGREVQELVAGLQVGMRDVFRTARPVLLSTSSATGLMEAAVRNGVRRRVLSLVNGAFSARFADIAEACGREVERLEVPWGEAHDPAALAERLASADVDAVTVVHSETSTGVLNPLAELAAVVAERPDTLLLVDSVTGVGGAPMLADDWRLDFVLTGSQKALALPPGLAFAVASEAMVDRAATLPDRGLYFDLVKFMAELARNQTPTTPALTLLYALETQLRRIADETMEGRWARHAAMAERCESWVEEMRRSGRADIEILASPGRRSPTVTCVRLAAGRRGPDVVAAVRERGWVIGGGYGKLKEDTVRIGHMGDHTVQELDGLLAVLSEVLTS